MKSKKSKLLWLERGELEEKLDLALKENEKLRLDNESAFYQLFHADVSSESEIQAHNYKVKDLVCILIAQRDELRQDNIQMKDKINKVFIPDIIRLENENESLISKYEALITKNLSNDGLGD